ncbi:signal peptide peptidase SppA [candidate division WOR-3 bacterium]|nr:signal peptide peptidase SppA [candidate division WOR-3 bacterium]
MVLFTIFFSKLIFDLFKNLTYQPQNDAKCLYIRLSGNYREIPGFFPIDFLSQYNDLTIEDIVQSIKKARNDDQIDAIFLEIHSIDNGWSTVSDIRSELDRFRQNGKKVYAYIYSASDKEYYLASVADSIFLSPTGSLFIDGLSASVLFLSGLSNKLGIKWEVFSKGDYKSAPNILTDSCLSEYSREDLEKMLLSTYSLYVEEVEKSREDLPFSFTLLLDSGPYLSAQKAFSLRLVDALEPYEKIYSNFNLADSSIYPRKYLSQDINAFAREKPICVVFIEGEISYENEGFLSYEDGQDARSIAQFIMEAADDPEIKSIVLRINSPGGDLDASYALGKAVEYASQNKPVVVSMGDVAASGGYFTAMYSDYIVASKFTVTGSIGVFMIKPDLSGLLLKTGLSVDTVKTNVCSDFMSPYRPLNQHEAQILENYASEAYLLFTSEVSKNRDLDSAFVESIAGGRIWMGFDAFEIGLVDTIGGLDLAVKIAKEMAQIPVESGIGVRVFPEPSFNFKNLRNRTWMYFTSKLFPGAYEFLILKKQPSSITPCLLFPYEIDIR